MSSADDLLSRRAYLSYQLERFKSFNFPLDSESYATNECFKAHWTKKIDRISRQIQHLLENPDLQSEDDKRFLRMLS
jgi:hypothetical protein